MCKSIICPVFIWIVQSNGDLSSFAMPHLEGSDNVGKQMDLVDKRVQSVDSMHGETWRREGGRERGRERGGGGGGEGGAMEKGEIYRARGGGR